MFYIKDFHPEIKEELLFKGLRFVQEYIDITSKDREILYHVLQIIAFWWKGHMDEKAEWFVWGHHGSHHGAGECELVGTYMLSLIPEKYSKKDFRLHPDDRLRVERIKVDRKQNI